MGKRKIRKKSCIVAIMPKRNLFILKIVLKRIRVKMEKYQVKSLNFKMNTNKMISTHSKELTNRLSESRS